MRIEIFHTTAITKMTKRGDIIEITFRRIFPADQP